MGHNTNSHPSPSVDFAATDAHSLTSTDRMCLPISQNLSLSLSLIALCSLAGAGVAVGSGVAMMAGQAMEAEAKATQGAVAHSVLEKRFVSSRGFAASME